MAKSVVERFSEKYIIDQSSGCWLWFGCLTQPNRRRPNGGGYGLFLGGKKLELAHRFSYSHYVAPIPDGMVIDHLCRRRNCVNPEHLEVVTISENCRRGLSPRILGEYNKTRAANKTHCPKGHQYSPENVYTQVSARDGAYRVCKICRKDAYTRGNAKQKAARCST